MIEADGLIDAGRRAMGRYLRARLDELAARISRSVSTSRGRGLMCAFSLPTTAERDELHPRAVGPRVIMLACGPTACGSGPR